MVNLLDTHRWSGRQAVPSLPLAHEKWFVDDPGGVRRRLELRPVGAVAGLDRGGGGGGAGLAHRRGADAAAGAAVPGAAGAAGAVDPAAARDPPGGLAAVAGRAERL